MVRRSWVQILYLDPDPDFYGSFDDLYSSLPESVYMHRIFRINYTPIKTRAQVNAGGESLGMRLSPRLSVKLPQPRSQTLFITYTQGLHVCM